MSMSQNNKISLINPLIPFLNIYSRSDLLTQLVRRNILVRYKGTFAGLAWMIINPLVMLTVYTFVFSVVFKVRWGAAIGDSKVAFAMNLFCGLVLFNMFAESINGAVSSITNNPNYVKKVVFPLEILPVSVVMSSLFFGLVSFAILTVSVAILMHKLSIALICLPLLLLPLLLFTCGIAWFVASLGVYMRDLAHIIGIVLQVLIFLTPVFFSIEMVPEHVRFFFHLNPLTTIIQSARAILLLGQWPDWYRLSLVTGFSFVFFQLGYFWFIKTKRGFADVL